MLTISCPFFDWSFFNFWLPCYNKYINKNPVREHGARLSRRWPIKLRTKPPTVQSFGGFFVSLLLVVVIVNKANEKPPNANIKDSSRLKALIYRIMLKTYSSDTFYDFIVRKNKTCLSRAKYTYLAYCVVFSTIIRKLFNVAFVHQPF